MPFFTFTLPHESVYSTNCDHLLLFHNFVDIKKNMTKHKIYFRWLRIKNGNSLELKLDYSCHKMSLVGYNADSRHAVKITNFIYKGSRKNTTTRKKKKKNV